MHPAGKKDEGEHAKARNGIKAPGVRPCARHRIQILSVVLFCVLWPSQPNQSSTICKHNNTMGRRVFLVTGANSGIGLEATRQLLASGAKVYMLCRSEERAENAILELGGGGGGGDEDTTLVFCSFDAYDTSTMQESISRCISEDYIDGVLLNAGGFGDDPELNKKCSTSTTGASKIAQLNLIGHAALVQTLVSQGKLGKGTKIVASGSEACFATPGPFWEFDTANLRAHLAGEVRGTGLGAPYVWIKGIVALYWAAFARRYPDLYVVTVSPGSVTNTNFYQHGGVTWTLQRISRLFVLCMGNHNVQEGAKRYIDVLLSQDYVDDGCSTSSTPSGSFLAHRIGYNKNFGDVTEHKRGAVFGDEAIQDRAWEAVEAFL
jgi:retinol dehydrogenase-13